MTGVFHSFLYGSLLSPRCCHRLVGVYIALIVTSNLIAIWSYLDLLKDLKKHNKAQPLATRLAVCFAMALNGASVIIGQGSGADRAFGITNAVLSLLAVVLTCRGETTGITAADGFCLGISMLGAILFLLTGESLIGVLFAVMADLIGYIPTLRRCWTHPETQPFKTYLISLCGASLSLTATAMYDRPHVTSIFTAYLVVIDTLIPTLILTRKELQRATAIT